MEGNLNLLFIACILSLFFLFIKLKKYYYFFYKIKNYYDFCTNNNKYNNIFLKKYLLKLNKDINEKKKL